MDELRISHSCAVCGKEAEQKCASCGTVYYCGRDHQRKHWKTHRPNCRCYRVETSPTVGRHLTASRDVKAGEVILQDKPLVVGPKQFQPACLGCYRIVDKSFECPKCGWFMCGEECCKSEDHIPECKLTQRYRSGKIQIKAFEENDNNVNYDYMQSVMILRCLYLREAQPSSWQELLNLESHSRLREKLGLEHIERAVIVQFLREVVHLSSEDYPDDLILKICGIVYVNSFELPIVGDGIQGVFGKVSLLEHDCVANAVNAITSNRELVVRAAIPISKGEKIAITYTDPMWGTRNRQHHLQQTKFFRCLCDRCRDATELGTMMSGIICQNCSGDGKRGVILLQNPTEENTHWRCNACGIQKTDGEIARLMEDVGKDLVSLKRGSIEACETFLARYRNILHPHHFYMAEVKMVLCQMYGHIKGQTLFDLNEQMLSNKEALCLELIKIVDVIAPGMTRLRAAILYEMQAVMALRSRRLWANNEIDREELKTHVKLVHKMLQEAATIFSWEPEESDEGQLALVAQKELADVDAFYRSLL